MKKALLFCGAGMCLVLATGTPATCQLDSPGPIPNSPMGSPERPEWVRLNANAEQLPRLTPDSKLPQVFCSADLLRKMMETIRQIEKERINYNEEARDREYFEWIPGKIPILISAPHGAKHYRTRKSYWKEEEAYTASLAIALGQATGAHVIYTKNKTREDPNNDPTTRYKETVRQVVSDHGIKFLIDLHGARRGQPFKVDVGILHKKTENSSCPTFKKIVEKNFADFQKEIFNQKFTANDRCTLTSFARKDLKIEAIQVEINARLRRAAGRLEDSTAEAGGNPDFRAEEKEFLDLVARIERMIREVHEKIKSDCPPA